MNQQQEVMAAAASAGFSAIMWILDEPDRFLAFCAWAESKTGQSFGAADRPHMLADGKLLWKLCETLEAQ